jgi:LacI family repressor for deo operon, udp, cdd, tsx, nupC, and nupG
MTLAAAAEARRNPSNIVLCLIPGLGNSFWNVIINAIEDVLIRAGSGVIFGDTRSDPVREAHYERLIRAGHADGLILCNARPPPPAFTLLDTGIPATLIYSDLGDTDRFPTFGVASREAARMMIEHLIGLGHRRIAHIAGPDGNVDAQERVRGYSDALAAADIALDRELIIPGGFTFVAGAKAAQRFLALAPRPTAIFAASDEMAIGCIAGLKEAGIAVPADVSVAGFDGIDYSAMFDPALTTMLQPRAELGRLAAESLLRQLAGAPAEAKRVRLPCKLLIRESVAPVGDGMPEPMRRMISEPGARDRKAEASR